MEFIKTQFRDKAQQWCIDLYRSRVELYILGRCQFPLIVGMTIMAIVNILYRLPKIYPVY